MRVLAVIRGLLLAAGLLVVAALPSYAAPQARNRPDSFVQLEVYTPEEFMTQVDSDPVLRKRLAKHFHIPEAQLVSYLRSELETVTFEQSGWGIVYGVTKIGQIYPVRFHFKEGTNALGVDGTPFFRIPCGNPLDVWVRPDEWPVHGFTDPPLSPRIEVPLESVVYVAPQEYVLLGDIPRAPVFRVPVTTARHRFIPFWWPSGGDGDGDGRPPPPPPPPGPPPPPPPPPVPEPGTIILLGAGLAVLGGRFVRFRR